MKKIIYTLLLGLVFSSAFAQSKNNEAIDSSNVIQLSGLVLDGKGQDLEPIPYVTVSVKGTSRGAYTNWEGFFSIVAEKGETIIFSAVGYKETEFVVPDTLTDFRYSVVQMMTMDTINLPETVVFPWPSREHFKLEFLAMNVDDKLEDNATENIKNKTIAYEALAMDGNENNDFYLRQQAKASYHYGQVAPMQIFNPMAWAKFFKAWKDGAFKSKKDKKRKK